MKKIFLLVLLLSLSAFLVISCGQSSSSTSSTTAISEAAAAQSVALLSQYCMGLDNAILGVAGMSVVNPASVSANSLSTPTVDGNGWWSASGSYSLANTTYDINYNFKIWRNDGTPVNTVALLAQTSSSDIGTLWLYTTYSITDPTSSFSMSIGNSTSDPIIFENYSSTSATLTGTVIYQGDNNGTTYSTTMGYNTVTVNNNGYPDGTLDVTITSGNTTVFSATITFDGTNTAILTFTAGGSGTYTVDIDTGAVTVASI
ncbi:MAG: hypothetical protein HQ596_00025 [Candidatus Saganbacteria bacterium]|nr:hypothetical protein [Candidatus Saganbacteria bacterium]